MSPPDELIVTCSCSSLHHSVRFTFWPYDDSDDTKGFEAYVEVSLDYDPSWWRRLKVAVQYLFGRTCRYGKASEIVVKEQDLPKLRSWLERAEHEAKRWT